MSQQFYIILVDSLGDGNKVIDRANLDSENCAVITEPLHLSQVDFDDGEVVYTAGDVSINMLVAFFERLNECEIHKYEVTLKIVDIS